MESSASTYIELYLEQELLMAGLYQRFEKRYAAHQAFWNSLVSDELEHAGYIKQFQELTAANVATFSEGKARIAALRSILGYIKSVIEEFDRRPFQFQKAVGLSLDLEKSVLERDVFRRFESDCGEFGKVLDILREAQEAHLEKVKEYNARHTQQVPR